MFSVLDAGQVYYRVKLSEAGSKLLWFNTLFGHLDFCRMPFGIKSAPEIYQTIASQIFDNTDGVEEIIGWSACLGKKHGRAPPEVTSSTPESQSKQPYAEW